MAATEGAVLALDVGERRIGVALAYAGVAIAQPLTTIAHDATALDAIARLADEHRSRTVVVGLPRNLNGDPTGQTEAVRRFARELESRLGCTILFQDEALTSVKAEAELTARKKPFGKAEVDALAATYILEDYLAEHTSLKGRNG